MWKTYRLSYESITEKEIRTNVKIELFNNNNDIFNN